MRLAVALYHWLANHKFTSDAIDVMRFRAWRALSYDNQANTLTQHRQAAVRKPIERQRVADRDVCDLSV